LDFFRRNPSLNPEPKWIGDRNSLAQQIHDVTGIPLSALTGRRLSQFTVEERLMWSERRQTSKPEDKVYSLLGILDIEMPVIYEEGASQAYARLKEVLEKRERCMRDLCVSDPQNDKKRIEETKGGLLEDSYCWVLENPGYQEWHNTKQNALLWVKGDPGKGKTMLLCGMINELSKAESNRSLISYFFCQATDPRINTATAVLRGLIYMLIDQQPSLEVHLRKKYDQMDKKVFEDANAWFALSEMFIRILQDPRLPMTYLFIDALDECKEGLPNLLRLIVEQSAVSPYVKWIITSRNWSQIAQQLGKAQQRTNLSLELNADPVSKAVDIYIKHRVLQLAEHKRYDAITRDAVFKHLSCNAGGTFLWVALVCQYLLEIDRWNVIKKLSEFPPGLDPLYERMLHQIQLSDSAKLCKFLLSAMSVVYRPVTLAELSSLGDDLAEISHDAEAIEEVIGLCGSFLTIRDSTIYFVHQSAKDFLLTDTAQQTCPIVVKDIHCSIFMKSLYILRSTLRRDIYNLQAPGCHIEQIRRPHPDPLAAARYACTYWMFHVNDWRSADRANSKNNANRWKTIHAFATEFFLYWLEALSLCRSMSEVVLSLTQFEKHLQVRKISDLINTMLIQARRCQMRASRRN
jgi:hypothetical protein